MATVRFTENIQRHISCPSETIDGQTVNAVLDTYFKDHSGARSYVLDEQGHVRQHMIIFLNGRPISDRTRLSDTVNDNDVIDVMQALSGG